MSPDTGFLRLRWRVRACAISQSSSSLFKDISFSYGDMFSQYLFKVTMRTRYSSGILAVPITSNELLTT